MCVRKPERDEYGKFLRDGRETNGDHMNWTKEKQRINMDVYVMWTNDSKPFFQKKKTPRKSSESYPFKVQYTHAPHLSEENNGKRKRNVFL
jgi:hypothetical protein